MLFTLSICFAVKAGKDSLILSISKVLAIGFEACTYDFDSFDWLDVGFLPLKYFEIVLTSLFNFAGKEGLRTGGDFSIDMGTVFVNSFLLLLLGLVLIVNLDEIFVLRVLVLLSVLRASHLASYTNDMKFQIVSPIPSKSMKSLTSLLLTCLLAIYLDMKFKESLMLLESDAKCSIDLCKEME